ncbi:hypothetical protein B0H13DRAFT_1871874 [Mycena leptocephala]|nr:hypothetical protein B0H13DRAFT_1871874 [Mycena leptocephala]
MTIWYRATTHPEVDASVSASDDDELLPHTGTDPTTMTGAANIKGGTPNHATEITVSGGTIIRLLIAAAMTGWWWCMLDFNRRLLELERGVFELKVDMVDRRLLELDRGVLELENGVGIREWVGIRAWSFGLEQPGFVF